MGSARPSRSDRQRGIALVAVLWMLILLAVLTANYSLTTRTSVALAHNVVGGAEAEALADAGLHRALAGLIASPDRQLFKTDGTPYAWAFADGQIRFAIEDEGGKIDLNGAPEPLLAALFRTVGVSPKDAGALAAAVVDFRDEDSDRLPNGAEDREYARERLPNGAKDAPFQLVEELLQVKGMTGDLFRVVAPVLTVHTGSEQPEPTVAPPEVAAALAELKGGAAGGKSAIAQSFLAGQREARRSRQAQAVEDRQEAVGRGGDQATSAIDDAEGSGEGSGLSTYSIHVEALTGGGSLFARDAVVRITGEQAPPYAILAWRRGQRWLFPAGR